VSETEQQGRKVSFTHLKLPFVSEKICKKQKEKLQRQPYFFADIFTKEFFFHFPLK